jgi:hypothetical protein
MHGYWAQKHLVTIGVQEHLVFFHKDNGCRVASQSPNVVVKGYWVHKPLVAARRFCIVILGIEMSSERQTFLCNNIGRRDAWQALNIFA